MSSVIDEQVAPHLASSDQAGETPALQHTDNAIQSLELFSAETVEQLSNGFLAVLEPQLVHVQQSLQELM